MLGRAKAIRPLIFGFLFLALLTAAIGHWIEITPSVPDHATVLVDWPSKTYFSPPYVDQVLIPDSPEGVGLEPMTLKMAKRWSCWPDRECARWSGPRGDCDGFTGRPYTLLSLLLAYMGLTPPLPSRWNDDGTWNY